ncbi:MAG: D-alanyl-D-alanine carboxypeptidase family protein, partial [Burkholderiaceae bacterium]
MTNKFNVLVLVYVLQKLAKANIGAGSDGVIAWTKTVAKECDIGPRAPWLDSTCFFGQSGVLRELEEWEKACVAASSGTFLEPAPRHQTCKPLIRRESGAFCCQVMAVCYIGVDRTSTRSATILVLPSIIVHTRHFSALSMAFVIAVAVLVPAPASYAAQHHAAKPAIRKKPPSATHARAPAVAQAATAGVPPVLPAKAWLLMDFDSGQVLASENPDEPLPPASLTKMMTSFLVEQALRSGKLKKDDLVSVSQNAWCRGSSTESCMYLPLNSQATVIDILRGIIIQSGNDASKAIAEHMAGTEENFAKLMNAEAQRIGMTHTHFMNATGMPDPQHKSSARDLAILARTIIRDSPDFYPIYAEREFKYNNIKQGNRNALLYTDPTVDGLKTGHTEEAGYCLVTSSKRNGMRLITVILNTSSMQARADETRTLLGWGFSSFEKVTPIQPNTVVGT